MGVIPKASLVITLAWPRLFIEGVIWVYDLLLADAQSRGQLNSMPLAMPGIEKVDVTKEGAREVLELFLSQDREDDDIFVRMMSWGVLILMFVLWCIKWFDAA